MFEPCEKSEKFQRTVRGDIKWANGHTSLEVWGGVQDGDMQKWCGPWWSCGSECKRGMRFMVVMLISVSGGRVCMPKERSDCGKGVPEGWAGGQGFHGMNGHELTGEAEE